LRFLPSRAIASSREDRRAFGEKSIDAFFDVRTGEDFMAVGKRPADCLLGRLMKRIPDSGADEAERECGAARERLRESDSGG